jgi:hypothetical protein
MQCKRCKRPIPTWMKRPIRCVCGTVHEEGEQAPRPPGKLPTISPVDRMRYDVKRWPRWAKALRYFSNDTDKGVGDTVERIARKVGGEEFKRWTKRLGIPCDCCGRQARWNQSYPYTPKTQDAVVHHFVSWEQLNADTHKLFQMILANHPDVSGIAGVPRSGMRVASDLALRLGVPLYEASVQHGMRKIGNGLRLAQSGFHGVRHNHSGPIVLVDDSVCSGYAYDRLVETHPELRKHPFYAVYAASPGRKNLTGFAVEKELPHYFAWNFFGNGNILAGENVGTDMDGVLCDDCPIADDDDGERYLKWMLSVKPMNVCRDFEIPFIVTARREPYRAETVAWLARHGVRYKNLIMYPGTHEERSRDDIAAWKAEQTKAFYMWVFVESSYQQALAMKRHYPTLKVISVEVP